MSDAPQPQPQPQQSARKQISHIQLADMTDEALDTLEKSIQAERERRIRQRQKSAEEQIKKLAQEAGLSVAIKERKKAGRKRKAPTG